MEDLRPGPLVDFPRHRPSAITSQSWCGRFWSLTRTNRGCPISSRSYREEVGDHDHRPARNSSTRSRESGASPAREPRLRYPRMNLGVPLHLTPANLSPDVRPGGKFIRLKEYRSKPQSHVTFCAGGAALGLYPRGEDCRWGPHSLPVGWKSHSHSFAPGGPVLYQENRSLRKMEGSRRAGCIRAATPISPDRHPASETESKPCN